MIPKIIHACWFGDSCIPKEEQNFIDGWRKILPDYEIRIYKNKELLELSGDNEYIKNALANRQYAFVSDHFRFTVLYKFGGIYLDTDVEVKKSFNPFLNCKIFMGFIFDSLLGTAIIGAEKGQDLLLQWRDNVEKDFARTRSYSINNNVMTKYFLDNYEDFLLNGKRQSLKCGVEIYPKDYFERLKISFKGDGGYALHHCAGSWKTDKKTKFYVKLAKKIVPRRIVSFCGHKSAIKKTPYYLTYLEHKTKK